MGCGQGKADSYTRLHTFRTNLSLSPLVPTEIPADKRVAVQDNPVSDQYSVLSVVWWKSEDVKNPYLTTQSSDQCNAKTDSGSRKKWLRVCIYLELHSTIKNCAPGTYRLLIKNCRKFLLCFHFKRERVVEPWPILHIKGVSFTGGKYQLVFKHYLQLILFLNGNF